MIFFAPSMRFNNFSQLVLTPLLALSICMSLLPTVHAADSVAQTTLHLIFPNIKADDPLAVDPGNTLGSYLVAYFARLNHILYNQQDARRLAISLGLIDKDTSLALVLDSSLLRTLSYRHRILFSDDPVASIHGSDGDIGRHITLENYGTLKIVNDYIHYYTERLKDATLPARLAETLTFRKLRFEALRTTLQAKATPTTVVLGVPFFKQERALSCEMASLRSLLTFYGYTPKEQTLIDLLGVGSPLQFKNGIWADPQLAFVGKIDGSQIGMTGYGTYWKAVARVAQGYKPELNWFEGGNLQTLTSSIDAGNPVQIWTVVSSKGGFAELVWQTPDGTKITGYNGEHTWVVDGYKGTADKPTSFHVVDPFFGPKDVTVAELTKQWARYNNSGVRVQ